VRGEERAAGRRGGRRRSEVAIKNGQRGESYPTARGVIVL